MTVDGTIKKILDYGARPLSEFNKFEALDMLEVLQNTVRDHGDTKAGFFRLAYQSARSKLGLPVEHFRSLVLRCVGDRDHSKIFDIVAKVEVAKPATPDGEKRVAYRGNPQHNYTPQRRLSSIRCYNCNQWGHRAARCRNRRGDKAQTRN